MTLILVSSPSWATSSLSPCDAALGSDYSKSITELVQGHISIEKMKINEASGAAIKMATRELLKKENALIEILGEEKFHALYNSALEEHLQVSAGEKLKRQQVRQNNLLVEQGRLSFWMKDIPLGKNSTAGVMTISGSFDRRYVVVNRPGKSLSIWDLSNGQNILDFNTQAAKLSDIRFARLTPDGETLFAGPVDGYLAALDPKTGEQKWSIEKSVYGLRAIAFSDDGRIMLTATESGGFTLHDGQSGRIVRFWSEMEKVYSATLSPDGKYIAIGFDKGITKILDRETGNLVKGLPRHSSKIRSVQFNRSGRMLMIASSGGGAELWDTETWEIYKTLQSPDKDYAIYSVAFMNDERFVIGTVGNKILIWEVFTGKIIDEIDAPTKETLYNAIAGPEDKSFVSVSTGGHAILYRRSAIVEEK